MTTTTPHSPPMPRPPQITEAAPPRRIGKHPHVPTAQRSTWIYPDGGVRPGVVIRAGARGIFIAAADLRALADQVHDLAEQIESEQ